MWIRHVVSFTYQQGMANSSQIWKWNNDRVDMVNTHWNQQSWKESNKAVCSRAAHTWQNNIIHTQCSCAYMYTIVHTWKFQQSKPLVDYWQLGMHSQLGNSHTQQHLCSLQIIRLDKESNPSLLHCCMSHGDTHWAAEMLWDTHTLQDTAHTAFARFHLHMFQQDTAAWTV